MVFFHNTNLVLLSIKIIKLQIVSQFLIVILIVSGKNKENNLEYFINNARLIQENYN
jgi:hypothetical protein